jgi:hypothetical protein
MPHGAGYDAYLASTTWEQKRQVVLARDGHKCAGCRDESNLHVHHCTYERFGNELLTDLITLCQACHKAVHELHRLRGGDLAMATAEALSVLRAGQPIEQRRRRGKRRPVQTSRRRPQGPLTSDPRADEQEAAGRELRRQRAEQERQAALPPHVPRKAGQGHVSVRR